MFCPIWFLSPEGRADCRMQMTNVRYGDLSAAIEGFLAGIHPYKVIVYFRSIRRQISFSRRACLSL